MLELEINLPGAKCCVIKCHQKQRFWVGANGIDDYTFVCADHVEDVKKDGDVVICLRSLR